jgi:hypothetical protein
VHVVLSPDMVATGPAEALLEGLLGTTPFKDIFAQYISEPADECILRSSQLGFLDIDFSSAGFDQNFGNFLNARTFRCNFALASRSDTQIRPMTIQCCKSIS